MPYPLECQDMFPDPVNRNGGKRPRYGLHAELLFLSRVARNFRCSEAPR
jgi:hypothetical protein